MVRHHHPYRKNSLPPSISHFLSPLSSLFLLPGYHSENKTENSESGFHIEGKTQNPERGFYIAEERRGWETIPTFLLLSPLSPPLYPTPLP